jgi:FlaG/FlaF family flagellin (archaellin)
MKLQRWRLNQQAVSAVIGVTLMVAVTIAMAAVAYAYFTGMIGGQNQETPVISFSQSEADNILTVSTADANINWEDIEITFTDTSGGVDHLAKTGAVAAGNTIDLDTDQTLTGTVSVTFKHTPSNTLMGDEYTFHDVV